jgi:hypothetical protein
LAGRASQDLHRFAPVEADDESSVSAAASPEAEKNTTLGSQRLPRSTQELPPLEGGSEGDERFCAGSKDEGKQSASVSALATPASAIAERQPGEDEQDAIARRGVAEGVTERGCFPDGVQRD